VSAPNWFTHASRFFGRFRVFYTRLEAAKVGVRPSYMTLITVFYPDIGKISVGEGVFLAQPLQVQVVDYKVLFRRTSLSPAARVLCFRQDIMMVLK
jgi:hypothetical protein